MLIKASVRPRGVRKGVTTKRFYKETFGYTGEGEPDLRDVVGKLELSATRESDTTLLRALHEVCSDLYQRIAADDRSAGGLLRIYDQHGKSMLTYGSAEASTNFDEIERVAADRSKRIEVVLTKIVDLLLDRYEYVDNLPLELIDSYTEARKLLEAK